MFAQLKTNDGDEIFHFQQIKAVNLQSIYLQHDIGITEEKKQS